MYSREVIMTGILSWNQMVSMYPNLWVVIKNAVMDGPDVIEGEVVTTKTDDEICGYEDAHDNEGYLFRRTSEEDY